MNQRNDIGNIGKTKKKILIIGGVAAGTSAASKARRLNPAAEITIIQNEPMVSYGSCGIPYVIEGQVDDFTRLIARTRDDFKNKHDINIITNTIATRIDSVGKKVYAKDLKTLEEIAFDYDSLILATGARAIVPKIKGMSDKDIHSFDNLFFLRSLNDGVRINEFMKNAKTAIIVGAGLIGMEMAEAFKKRGVSVALVEMADHVLPSILDSDMAEMVEEELKNNGINVVLDEKVEEIVLSHTEEPVEGHNDLHAEGIRTNKRKISADCILLGIGVVPNSEIAKEAGIKIGVHNAIKVDGSMRTSIPDIFAAGDCATARNYLTDGDDYLPLGTTSNKQGRIAGENAALNGNARFCGIAGSAITKTFGLLAAKTGLNKKEAEVNGFYPVESTIDDITRAGYYPGNKPIWIKLVADKPSRQILGAQIVGGESVKGRIDLVSFALLTKATVDDVANFDACYVPPVSPVWEPLNIAASQLLKLID